MRVGWEGIEMNAKMLVVVFLFVNAAGFGFNGHVVREGPVKVTIGEIEKPTEFDEAVDVEVTVENGGGEAVQVVLEMGGLVDEWYFVGSSKRVFVCGAGAKKTTSFQIACAKGGLSALYPVHVYASFNYDNVKRKLHCVQIFESDFRNALAADRKTMSVNIVPRRGALSLASVKTQRVRWQFFGRDAVQMPIGWKGTDGKSGAFFNTGMVNRDTTKNAITMHPAWRGRSGTVLAEYLVKLPETEKIRLHFANAIRNHTADEPASDGVTFRVWANDKVIFSRHTDSKKWLAGNVDLGQFAGRQISLKLESHPGPKKNTTCDSSHWGEPVIIAGDAPRAPVEANRRIRLRQAAKGMNLGSSADSRFLIFDTADKTSACIVLGDQGLLDSAIAFGKTNSPDSCVVFEGVNVSIMDATVGELTSPVVVVGVDIRRQRNGSVNVIHHLAHNDKDFDLSAVIFAEKGGLRIKFECPERITDISLGAADQKAPRVYYGHGYCIENPKAFSAGFGGHNLSTSHVGFDFEKGTSLLVATDNPPDRLEVTPDRNIYALHTHHNATLTFVPSVKGAFDCAVNYQKLYDKKPSPGFEKKAGRFVFDIWGGRYAQIADTMQQMADYGLTDSILTLHVWQRWGYDYRLPDIYPPNPAYGTIDDMKRIGAVCDRNNIYWGLHDNYIDFYPDAEDYSYDDICFTESGEPLKAWINTGRNAQSYRWRPDRFMPFVKRNMQLIKRDLDLSHYFIDVFTSIGCFDYYDKEGRFHSSLETRKYWGESFCWIQDYFAGAVTTSEAGHDQLTGYLDGADCQHLTISNEGVRFTIGIPCDNWQRVPWFDAVLHDKFSLHGAGYPSRYRLTEFDDHSDPLESDDYICAEILTGHALMIDRGAFGRGAIRKYWLGQDFIKSIATDRIKQVEFADDNIHRQIVTWNSGARVFVNRGKEDWSVAGKVLPQYGYFATNGAIESSIEKIDGVIVERSKNRDKYYFNGRGYSIDNRLQIRPQIGNIKHFGGRRFTMAVNWDIVKTPSKDLGVFIHFDDDEGNIVFQGDGRSQAPMSKWSGQIVTGADRIIYIPEKCPPGEYAITAGVWDPSTGRRYPLLGDNTGDTRYKLGTLTIEGDKNTTALKLAKHKPAPPQKSRRNINAVAIDFGKAKTAGAFRCESTTDHAIVTPLANIDAFEIMLKLDKRAKSITAIDPSGKSLRNIDYTCEGTIVKFETIRNDFAYRITFAN